MKKKIGRAEENQHRRTGVTTMQRQYQAALLATLHDLRLSINRNRAMSLPNTLRLCRRRLSNLNSPPEVLSSKLRILEQKYRSAQPFRGSTKGI